MVAQVVVVVVIGGKEQVVCNGEEPWMGSYLVIIMMMNRRQVDQTRDKKKHISQEQISRYIVKGNCRGLFFGFA